MAGDYDNTPPRVPAPPPPRYFAAHQEHFEDVEVGEPVSSENTSFQRFFGEVKEAGEGIANGLYGTKAVQISAADGPAALGWHDVGLFDLYGTGVSRRVTITAHMRVDARPVDDEMHIAWMSEREFAILPPHLSIGVSPAGNLVSTGQTLESGSAAIPTGQWVRVVLEAGETPSGHLLCGVDLWAGEAIENPTPQNRAGRLSGIISGGATAITDGAWFNIGNHGTFSPTAGQISLDAIAIDAWAAPPIPSPASTEPGMNWWDGSRTRKAGLLGWWDGTTVQPAEMLGIWNGETVDPAPE